MKLPLKLPLWVQDLLLRYRQAAAHVLPLPSAPVLPALPVGTVDPLTYIRRTPLKQPDRTSCGSSVLVMMQLLHDPAYAEKLLGADDPVAAFGQAALAMRRQTNAPFDRRGLPQVPWPAKLGTRPGNFMRQLGRGWRKRWVNPFNPGAAYDAILAAIRAGETVPVFVGEPSWTRHIVLVVDATETKLRIYDPARGSVINRTREQFETATLNVAGWAQAWLVILPA